MTSPTRGTPSGESGTTERLDEGLAYLRDIERLERAQSKSYAGTAQRYAAECLRVADNVAAVLAEIARLTALVEDGRRQAWPEMWCETCRKYQPVSDNDDKVQPLRDLCCTSCGLVLVTYRAADPQGDSQR